MKQKGLKIAGSVTAGVVVTALVAQLVVPYVGIVRNNTTQTVVSGEKEVSFNVQDVKNVTNIINESITSSYAEELDIEIEETMDANSEVSVIVTMEQTSLLDKYLASSMKDDLNTYISSTNNLIYSENLIKAQNNLFNDIKSYCLSGIKYNYTTLLNGFSTVVKYGDVAKIEKVTGVKSVIISETYKAQTVESTNGSGVTSNDVNVYDTGIYDSSNVNYDGSGTIVAVLDTGLDFTHSAFQIDPYGDVVYSKDQVTQLVPNTVAYQRSANKEEGPFTLTGNDVYYSKKVPFAYDYADNDANVYPTNDHGTHVAGIIAGQDDTITGVATNAQLAIFKVFSDVDEGAQTEDILAALQDCIILNVDVINMSLGSSCGFARDKDDEAINDVYDGIKEAGIALICAASNDYSAAFGSENGDTNLASNPDSGTVGSPSSYPAAMSVASISGVLTPYFDLNGEAVYYTESNTTTGDKKEFMKELLGDKESITLDYEVIPGLGNSSDYVGIDVKGKVAVVKRGTITFEEKIMTAQAKGAIAVIIYNNQSGTISMSVGNKTVIPSCSISMDAGALFEKNPSGTVVFDKSNLAGPFMSGFSSWGVLPDLELKPDITAHGGDILSAVRGGYDRFSGTSMASPNMAGAATLVRQYVKEKYPNLTNGEITNLTYQLMMSTATIAKNEEGNPYSPRKQGAGIADILKATTTEAYLWVDGINKTKLSLGDDPNRTGHYVLTFNITNISNTAQSYNVAPSVFTESISSDMKTVAEKAYMFNDFSYTVEAVGATVSNNHVILAGYDTATITVTIDLSDADKAYLNEKFINGEFVEGYVELTNDGEGVNLNIPYCAFYGDWTEAPILDITEYEYSESQFDSAVVEKDKLKADGYATVPMGGYTYNKGNNKTVDAYYGLGVYGYLLAPGYEKPQSKEEYAAITQNEDGFYTLKGVEAGLLRGAKSIDYIITNANTGELVYQNTAQNGRKSHYSGGRTGGLVEVDLKTTDFGLVNNTKYHFEMVCYLDWEGEQHNKKNTFEFDFYVDSEAPVMQEDMTKVRIKEDIDHNKTYYLDMYVYDNHYLECYSIHTFDTLNADGSFEGEEYLIEYTIPIESVYNTTNKVTLDITNYWIDLQASGKQLAVEFIDYARNTSTYTFSLPDTEATGLSFSNSTFTLKKNATYDLFELLTMDPADSFKHLITWESSDESVVRVKDGELFGVDFGTATITATSSKGATATITIKVEGEKKYTPTLEGLDLTYKVLSLEQGETKTITAKCEPWYYDSTGVEVKWRTTNSKIATIVVDPDDPYTVTIKAIASGNCNIVCQSGSYIMSKITLVVEEEFEIEGRMLKKYHGRGDENGVVTIPDDKGIIYIYQYAFLNNDYITKIIIPEGVTTLYRAAIYGNENLEEIVMPESMENIQDFGCAWNPKLKKVNLGGTKTIHDYGFINDYELEDIDLSRVHNICNYGFYGCKSLVTADLSTCGGVSDMAFANCTSLKNIILTEQSALLGTKSFYRCTSLTSVTLPIDYLGAGTFEYCTSLKEVIFTKNVSTIGDEAFMGCYELENVTYLGEVNTIGVNTFASCSSLKNVYLPAGLEILSEGAYTNSKNIENVTISRGAKLETISAKVFEGCPNVSEFVVEDGNKYLTEIDGILVSRNKSEVILVPVAWGNENVILPSYFVSIGDYAFANNESLKSIEMPGVKTIGEGAFYGCELLTTVNADSLATIGANAFVGCNSLVFTIPETVTTIGDYAFASITTDNAPVVLTIPASVTEIGEGAFSANNTYSSVEFAGTNVTYIPTAAFAQAGSLTKITLPVSVTEIGDLVFANSSSLATVTIPTKAKIANMGYGVYYGCTSLTFAYLPATITEIPSYTFYGCTAITSYNTTSNITTIGEKAFQGSGVKSVDFKSATEVKAYAFANTPITTVISSTVKNIGDFAFGGCTSLTTVRLPGVDSVGKGSFYSDTALTEFTALKITNVGNSAFYGCEALAKLTTPQLKTIGDGAFYGCNSLTAVSLPNLVEVGELAFVSTSLTTFNVAASVEVLGEKSFAYVTTLANFTVDANNKTFFVDNGVLYRNLPNGKYELVSYPAGRNKTSYKVLDNTVRIAALAFCGDESLKSVELPNTLKQIGNAAFADTNITKYIFHSYDAPQLESSYSADSEYKTYYCNFVEYFALREDLELTMVIPSNGNGYDAYVYGNYFAHTEVTTEVAPNEDLLYLRELLAKFPATITKEDADLVNEAYQVYQNLSKPMKAIVTADEKAKIENAKKALDALLG